MKRQTDLGDPAPSAGAPHASAIARRAVSITSAWKPAKRSQVIAVSKVSREHAAGDERVAQVGSGEESVAPRADGVPAARRLRALAGLVGARAGPRPPCAAARRSSAIRIGSSTGWCGGLEAEHQQGLAAAARRG